MASSPQMWSLGRQGGGLHWGGGGSSKPQAVRIFFTSFYLSLLADFSPSVWFAQEAGSWVTSSFWLTSSFFVWERKGPYSLEFWAEGIPENDSGWAWMARPPLLIPVAGSRVEILWLGPLCSLEQFLWPGTWRPGSSRQLRHTETRWRQERRCSSLILHKWVPKRQARWQLQHKEPHGGDLAELGVIYFCLLSRFFLSPPFMINQSRVFYFIKAKHICVGTLPPTTPKASVLFTF